MSLAITGAILSFLGALLAIPLVCKIAQQGGFVDMPGGRKTHDMPVPPLGGFVIFSIFLAASLIIGGLPWAVYAALGLILVTGVLDDSWEINATLKFAIHFLAAFVLVVFGGAQLHSLGNILGFGELELGIMSIPFSIACVVYILNAINMMDGLDGLAGGISFLILAWFFTAALWGGDFAGAMHIILVMAPLLGFLVYNLRTPLRAKATIFLGDAGSMALGLMIAWFAMTLSQGDHAVMAPASVAWIIALPIVDAFGLLVTRLKEKRPPFVPDRRHIHHHFVDSGYPVHVATPLIVLWSFALGAIGFLGAKLGVAEGVLGWSWVALWWGHALLTLKSEKFKHYLAKWRP